MSNPNVNVVVSGPKKDYTSTYKTYILRGNMSFADQVTDPNRKYVIKYDFDLGGEIVTIPENCVLEFDGGSLRNGTLQGYVVNDYLRPEWFGAKRDGVTDDTWAIQTCVDLMNVHGGTVLLNRGYYKVSHIDLKTKTNLKGAGIGATIIKSDTASEKGIINIVENSIQVIVSDLSIVGNKTQDGIYIYPVATTDGATYPMAYYLQEHTGVENNKQTYRNLTVENVYVGRCNYGMNLNNRAYRTVIQKCDVKYCVYGVKFSVTDSDVHNIYIEHCERSGFICRGSNNNVTDIKSIWNGVVAPYESFGFELRGSRNRYHNLEAQDNYCSGIASSGNENIYSNIIANGDGYAYDAELDDANDGLCEWYVNTLTSTYKNCVVTNYSTRQSEAGGYDKPFPKYPIKYGADGIGTGADITILGSTSGTWLAREPINIPDIIQSDNYFNINSAKVTAAPQYGYLVDEVFTSQQFKREFITSGQLTLIFEFTLGDIQFQNDIRVDLYGSPKLSIAFSEGKNLHIIRNSSTIESISCYNADVTKPIRICTTITPRYKSSNSWYYDIGLYIWYYDTELGVYRFATSRNTDYAVVKATASQSIRKVVFGDDQNGNLSNAFYLRTFMIAEKHGIPSSISYPNASISHLEHFFGFDFRSLNGLQRMDVGNTANRPRNGVNDEYISKGFQYFNIEYNKPQWFDGVDWITPLFPDFNDMLVDRFIEITSSTTEFKTLSPGKYRWSLATNVANVGDWPEDIPKAAGILNVMPLQNNTTGRMVQVLLCNASGLYAIRYPRTSDNSGLSWFVYTPTLATIPRVKIIGQQAFDSSIGKPVWWDEHEWKTCVYQDEVYLKGETYSKLELNSLITTPQVHYVDVTATAQTASVTDILPSTGEADTIYRVGCWNGTQYDDSCYSEYAWNGSAYVFLAKKQSGITERQWFIEEEDTMPLTYNSLLSTVQGNSMRYGVKSIPAGTWANYINYTPSSDTDTRVFVSGFKNVGQVANYKNITLIDESNNIVYEGCLGYGVYQIRVPKNYTLIAALYDDSSIACVVDTSSSNNYSLRRISCIGDSLTYADKYQSKLSQLLSTPLYFRNLGIGGEGVGTIFGRMNSIPFKLNGDITIPATTTAVQVYLKNDFGCFLLPLLQVDHECDCIIATIEGVLSTDATDPAATTANYYFTRKASGTQTAVKEGEEITIKDNNRRYGAPMPNDYQIIWVGENNDYKYGGSSSKGQPAIDIMNPSTDTATQTDFDNLMEMIKMHINATCPCKYLVLSPPRGTSDLLEATFLKTFGGAYVNVRKEMVNNGINIALAKGYLSGSYPTTQDLDDISNGIVPTSLRSDYTHFNNAGYYTLAEILKVKINNLWGIV